MPATSPSGAEYIAVTYRSGAGTAVTSSLDRVSIDEVAAGMPVREFRWYKGRQHYSGWYWAATMRQMVVYESRLELARIMLADFDPSVVSILGQPFQLRGVDGDRVRRHVPDLLLTHRSGDVTVIDVKAPHKRDDPQVRALTAWTRDTVALRGWGFEFWSGDSDQVLANIGFLAGYRRDAVIAQSLIPEVRAAVGGAATIADVERTLCDRGTAVVRPVLLHLLWRGVFTTDLTRPLGRLSVIYQSGVGSC